MFSEEAIQKLVEERDALQHTIEGLYAEAPAEAGFSMNFQMEHPVVGNTQVTFRGARAGDALKVVDHVRAFAANVTKNGWKFKVATPAPPPTPNGAAAIVREEGNGHLAAHIEAEAERIPDPPAGKVWHTIDAARVVIKPEPDSRVTLEFYESGHKWPDIKANKWKMDQARGLLKHVTSHDPKEAADLSLACRVYYTDGKEKNDKPGEFWKDIAHVRAIK